MAREEYCSRCNLRHRFDRNQFRLKGHGDTLGILYQPRYLVQRQTYTVESNLLLSAHTPLSSPVTGAKENKRKTFGIITRGEPVIPTFFYMFVAPILDDQSGNREPPHGKQNGLS